MYAWEFICVRTYAAVEVESLKARVQQSTSELDQRSEEQVICSNIFGADFATSLVCSELLSTHSNKYARHTYSHTHTHTHTRARRLTPTQRENSHKTHTHTHTQRERERERDRKRERERERDAQTCPQSRWACFASYAFEQQYSCHIRHLSVPLHITHRYSHCSRSYHT